VHEVPERFLWQPHQVVVVEVERLHPQTGRIAAPPVPRERLLCGVKLADVVVVQLEDWKPTNPLIA
jgi:hypothetical protein